MTAEIGHNSPPPVVAFSLHIEELFSLASGSTASPVTSDEQEAALDALLDDIRKARKDADEQRVIEKRPHDLAAAEVQKAWKPLLDRCDAAASAVKAILTPYRTAKQRAKDEAARKAREEAEAIAKAAQEALREADDLDAKYAAEIQLEQAAKLQASANRIDRTATGLRTSWTHRIINRRELLLHVVERYPEDLADMLNEFVRQKVAGGLRDMPGVEITQIQKAA